MCLALPGRVVSIRGADLDRVGQVSFGGVLREVNLACVPEAEVGDYVLVHVGMAISKVNEAEAERILAHWRQMGEDAGTNEAAP